MKRIRSWLLLGLLGMAGLLSIQSAHANSAPPPRRIWFYFDNGALPSAIQIIGCSDVACTQVNLLHEYGRCESGDCIDTPQALTAASDYFDCAEGRCLFATYAELPPYIKLAAQFADGDRSSAAYALTDNSPFSLSAVRVLRTETGLQIAPGTDIPVDDLDLGRISQTLPWLWPSGLLTLVVEMLVIGSLLRFVLKLPWAALPTALITVALANALSYPATWLFFPNLSAWSMAGDVLAGALALIAAIVIAALLVAARNTTRPRLHLVLSILAGLASVVACLASLPVLMLSGYGAYTPGPANGIAFPLMIVLAEAFAVIFETLFIYGHSKRQFTLPLTFFLVLAANAASFGVGLLAFTPLSLR